MKAWILPYTNTELFNRVLADLAHEFQLNRHQRVLLVLDQAGWHISHQLKLPEGLDLYFLPAYSPELQPAERFW
ncbi:transposase, partial [Pleurocapsales cyanobacterium LEGE 10410]|nr:transposase [Pleurocapsales cyanobacterium LEGE 10410]